MRKDKIKKEDAEKMRQKGRKKLETGYLDQLDEDELTVLLADIVDELGARSNRRRLSPGLIFHESRRVERSAAS